MVETRSKRLFEILAPERKTRLMDIGANPTHEPPYQALFDAGQSVLYGFEPYQDAYDRLVSQATENEKYYPYAVGRARNAEFKVCAGPSFSSLFEPSQPHIDYLGQWKRALQVSERVKIKTVALDDIEDMARPDFLKMDVQGAELEILNAGQETLSEAVAIMPEIRFFQIYEKEPMFGELDTALRKMGFMLLKILPGATLRIISSHIHRLRPVMTRSQMIDADAIYVRDLVTHDYSSEQLKHLALLADGVFHSIDLVLRCLDMLVERGELPGDAIEAYIALLPRNYLAPERKTA